eukprot:766930-Hanusia_phi.AAC.1
MMQINAESGTPIISATRRIDRTRCLSVMFERDCKTGAIRTISGTERCNPNECQMPCRCPASTTATIIGAVIGGNSHTAFRSIAFHDLLLWEYDADFDPASSTASVCSLEFYRNSPKLQPVCSSMEATMVQYPPQQQVYMQNGVPIPVATPADGYPGNQPMVYQQQRQTGNRGALGMGLAGGEVLNWKC